MIDRSTAPLEMFGEPDDTECPHGIPTGMGVECWECRYDQLKIDYDALEREFWPLPIFKTLLEKIETLEARIKIMESTNQVRGPLQPMSVKQHTLKCDPDVFKQSSEGHKDWEIRLNDRDFQVGDQIFLRETFFTGEQMEYGEKLIYTGRVLVGSVKYILHGPRYGLQDGWVIMSIKWVRTE